MLKIEYFKIDLKLYESLNNLIHEGLTKLVNIQGHSTKATRSNYLEFNMMGTQAFMGRSPKTIRILYKKFTTQSIKLSMEPIRHIVRERFE